MSIITLDDQLIHYEVLGRGKPVIFIHGWLGSWRYWWSSMQALSSQHRSFAFDLWGFGDSSNAADKYSLDDYTELLTGFVSQLSIQTPFILVGHALGAAVALRYALKAPNCVKKLITISLPLQGNYISPRLSTDDPAAIVSKTLGKGGNFNEVESELRKTDQQAMNKLAQELINYGNQNLVADLGQLGQPVMMVFGGQDPVVKLPENEYRQLKKPGHSRHLIALDDCSHFPMLQEKTTFNRLLLDFILQEGDEFTIEEKTFWQRRTR